MGNTLDLLTRGGGSTKGWPMVSMKGKTVVVTGSNIGMGYETAKNLAYHGAHVIMACRTTSSEETAKRAIEKIHSEHAAWKEAHQDFVKELSAEGDVNDIKVEFLPLDLASLKSVDDFSEAFKAKGYKLHRLICNAAIAGGISGAGQTDHLSLDGYEMHFQVNYLSHMLLILRLLPIMRDSGDDCRIISVSSFAHTLGTYNIEQVKEQKPISDVLAAYTNSKLYQVMMTGALERRLLESNVSCYVLNPGNINTQINRDIRESSRLVAWIVWFMNMFGGFTDDVTAGAATSIYLAVNKDMREQRGGYFDRGNASVADKRALKESEQEELWKYSIECLKDHLTAEHLQGME